MWFEELEGLESCHLHACQNLKLYRSWMVQDHRKLVCPRTCKIRDFILVLRRLVVGH